MNPRILGDLENVGGSSRPERHAYGFLIDAGLVAHASIVFAYDGLRPENNVLPGFVRADETWRTGGSVLRTVAPYLTWNEAGGWESSLQPDRERCSNTAIKSVLLCTGRKHLQCCMR